jgi:hypothetical protein
MAENKKSFILYADLIHTIEILPDEIAGKLFKVILAYVNDKDPKVEDLLLQISFEPIKQQLKRDLLKYEVFKTKQSDNGRLGGRPKGKELNVRNPNNPSLFLKSQKSLNDNVNEINIGVPPLVCISETDLPITKKIKCKKGASLPPSIDAVRKYFDEKNYSIIAANQFFDFYNPSEWHDSKGKKVLDWKQKARGVWFKDENLKPSFIKKDQSISSYV